jgi:hypothetical protein
MLSGSVPWCASTGARRNALASAKHRWGLSLKRVFTCLRHAQGESHRLHCAWADGGSSALRS